MTSSEQEDLVQILLHKSSGAPFIFEPENFYQRSSPLEPADLAWACNNTVLLMNMTASGRKSGEKLTEHNLDQLYGWMKEWQKGRHLTGSNAHQVFDVAYEDYENVILLSVTDGPNAYTSLESPRDKRHVSKDHGIGLVATVTQAVLRVLVEGGGTIVDIIDFVEQLPADGEKVGASAGFDRSTKYVEQSIAEGQELVGKDIDPVLVEEIRPLFSALREGPASIGVASFDGLKGLHSAMNDLAIREFHWTVLSLALLIQEGREVTGTDADEGRGRVIHYPPYLFDLIVTPMQSVHSAEMAQQWDAAVNSRLRQLPGFARIIMSIQIVREPFSIHPRLGSIERTLPSNVETRLRNRRLRMVGPVA